MELVNLMSQDDFRIDSAYFDIFSMSLTTRHEIFASLLDVIKKIIKKLHKSLMDLKYRGIKKGNILISKFCIWHCINLAILNQYLQKIQVNQTFNTCQQTCFSSMLEFCHNNDDVKAIAP